ncbi:GGDEF domain-containing protein [Streptomyces sp. SL54]|uniref:GGDEF domain-containing protein n=1 Tax=Streptantibioticus silvisoli TaxID=2705255 RepID=A0ABT6W7Z2_9ACTN|nr:GGDEF domain-containing protein [Streptantibioticus silvisoli]MDI5966871.1 GGDEF domain-containing protein [Streptantibioticus silvisoli]
MTAVVGIAQAVAAAHTPLDAARSSVERALTALDAAFATVAVRGDGERGGLTPLASSGTPPPDDPYSGHAVPLIDPYPQQSGAAVRRRGRAVAAPIVLHGRVWGELYVARGAADPVFGQADADFAAVLAAVVAAGIAQTERLEEARRLAFTDPLTGLANRRAVDARLEEALQRHRNEGTAVSLVVCDLNGLKRVNDSLGHEVGDRLLVGFGSVLSLCAATLAGSLAGRLGGDEFCLVAEGVDAARVEATAELLCERARWLGLGDGVAVGVASTDGGAGPVRSARRLLRLADAAQYRAKAERSARPVVAGRAVAELADATGPAGPAGPEGADAAERRSFRGRPVPGAGRDGEPGAGPGGESGAGPGVGRDGEPGAGAGGGPGEGPGAGPEGETGAGPDGGPR